MMKRISFVLLVILVLILAACGGDDDKQEDKVDPVAVSVQLNWRHDVEWTGFYLANELGYFDDENLNASLKLVFDADGNFLDPMDELIEGRADFAVIEGGQLLTGRADGKPVVAVAAIYQRHPLAFLSLPEAGIETPADLVGKTIQVSGNSVIMFQALLASQGISIDDVVVVERLDFSADPLFNGEADVIDAWVINEIAELTLAGNEYNAIFPSDYGLDMYPAILMTTEEMIANQPEVVESMVRALVKGTQAAVDDPEAAVAEVMERDSSLNEAKQVEGMRRSLPLLIPAGKQPGQMDAVVWETTHQMLLDQGILSGPIDLDAAYTLDFLTKAYED